MNGRVAHGMKGLTDRVGRLLASGLLLLFALGSLSGLVACGAGDDDGQRLGELIVGTWQRGWGEGDVIIEGDTEYRPENFSFDQFVFSNDGSYNGMMRSGSFATYNEFGDVIFMGSYRCDNNNLKLEFDNNGRHQVILAQVLSFSPAEVWIRYTDDELKISISLILRRLSDDTDIHK